jgi:hypothetical protein
MSPKAFISYSWSSPEHEAWTLRLAEDLVGSGVDVILDKWDLREGHDANVFMERMVNDPDIRKVILICDKKYKEKADGRLGGAGTEAQIITPTLYSSSENNKFCAVVAEKDDGGQPYIPTYYTGRIFIDLSDEAEWVINYERLVRWIFDKPLFMKPQIGSAPSYITNAENKVQLHTSTLARRAADAMKNGKSYWKAALTEYFTSLSLGFENFRLPAGADFETRVFESIESFTPYRNEAVELTEVVARYGTIEACDVLHKFF